MCSMQGKEAMQEVELGHPVLSAMIDHYSAIAREGLEQVDLDFSLDDEALPHQFLSAAIATEEQSQQYVYYDTGQVINSKRSYAHFNTLRNPPATRFCQNSKQRSTCPRIPVGRTNHNTQLILPCNQYHIRQYVQPAAEEHQLILHSSEEYTATHFPMATEPERNNPYIAPPWEFNHSQFPASPEQYPTSQFTYSTTEQRKETNARKPTYPGETDLLQFASTSTAPSKHKHMLSTTEFATIRPVEIESLTNGSLTGLCKIIFILKNYDISTMFLQRLHRLLSTQRLTNCPLVLLADISGCRKLSLHYNVFDVPTLLVLNDSFEQFRIENAHGLTDSDLLKVLQWYPTSKGRKGKAFRGAPIEATDFSDEVAAGEKATHGGIKPRVLRFSNDAHDLLLNGSSDDVKQLPSRHQETKAMKSSSNKETTEEVESPAKAEQLSTINPQSKSQPSKAPSILQLMQPAARQLRTKEEFNKRIKETEGVVFFVFEANWAKDSEEAGPLINRVLSDLDKDKFKSFRINCDDSNDEILDVVLSLNVSKIPTVLVTMVENGNVEEIARMSEDLTSEAKLTEFVNDVLLE